MGHAGGKRASHRDVGPTKVADRPTVSQTTTPDPRFPRFRCWSLFHVSASNHLNRAASKSKFLSVYQLHIGIDGLLSRSTVRWISILEAAMLGAFGFSLMR